MRFVLVLGVWCVAATAFAEDVVVLRDGTVVRGTLLESVPGDFVAIDTEGGTRRFEAADVRYAGPPREPLREAVEIRFEGEPGLQLFRAQERTTATAWTFDRERLCAAPCTFETAAGAYELGLARPNGAVVPAGPVDLMETGTLTGLYIDRSALRIAGWTTMIVGALGGGAMMIVPFVLTEGGNEDDETAVHWMMAGASALIVAEIIGIILAVQPDGAAFRFD